MSKIHGERSDDRDTAVDDGLLVNDEFLQWAVDNLPGEPPTYLHCLGPGSYPCGARRGMGGTVAEGCTHLFAGTLKTSQP